jgi:hypothetical protein
MKTILRLLTSALGEMIVFHLAIGLLLLLIL